MASLALIQFEEQRYQVFFLDIRIFIQGVEVTQHVTGTVTITKSNRDGAGSASFTLDNALDRFIITEENLDGVWRDTNDKYSEAAKHSIYLYKKGAREATQDRIAELINERFEKNLAAIQSDKDEKNKRRGKRNVDRKDAEISPAERKELENAVSDTLQDLSAEDIERNIDDVGQAVFEQLAARGLSQRLALEIADEQSNRRFRQLTKSNRVRPTSDGPVKEINEDGTLSEGSGRHKRQKHIRNPIDPDTGDSRWPLAERSTVFHKNDTVRIFIHNPLTEDDWWLYGFTGFINTYPVQTDYITNQSTLTINCFDIRALMQKMRIGQNAHLPLIAPEPLFLDRTSIFADLLVSSRWGSSFANLSFEEAISRFITGTGKDGKGGGRQFGVGEFQVGKIVTYPKNSDPTTPDSKAILEELHTLCINGPSDKFDPLALAEAGQTQLFSGLLGLFFGRFANMKRLTSADVLRIGRGSTISGPSSPLRGFVHFLLPEEGTAARNLVQIGFDAGTDQRDWVTRFEVVTDFCARIDYEWTVLPNGDMAFEFPMYDFSPEDFGDWKNVFEADLHLVNGSFSDEGEDIITALIVQGGVSDRTRQLDITSEGGPRTFALRGVVQSSIMAARVGVTVDNASLPFVASRERLRSLGLVEFQKRLANANSLDMDFGFRPFITPNRPLLNKVEKRIGLTSSITETIGIFDKASTAASVRFIRQVREDGKFRFITGGDSMPISYRNIFPGNVKSVGNTRDTGVRDTLGVDGEQSALESASEVTQGTVEEGNEDRPPSFIKEIRPGPFFTLTPTTRQVVEILAQSVEDAPFLLNNIPEVNGRSFSIRARDDGHRLYSPRDRETFAVRAKENGYLLIDTGTRFIFEPRRPGQPDFIVRPDNG